MFVVHLTDICIVIPTMTCSFSAITIQYIMIEKEQSKGLELKCQIKKDRVPGYPFHVVTTTHSQQDLHFIMAVDYINDTTIISVYPFKKDMTKLMTSTLQLTDILSRKIVSTIHVKNFSFKPSTSSITIIMLELVLGYRTGQLVVVQWKDKDCRIKLKLNHSIKSEGFFSRTTTAIFGGEECYQVYFANPIRSYQIQVMQATYKHSYQVGNCIILCKQLDDRNEHKLFNLFNSMDDKKVSERNNKKIIQNGDYFVYNCQHYYALFEPQSGICLIDFKNSISSYFMESNNRQLIVSCKDTVIIIDVAQQFTLKTTITADMPIRKIQAFTFSKELYLTILPYDNYILIVSLAKGCFVKLGGHKSFIASIYFVEKQNKIVTAGMDHRISIISMSKIKESAWISWMYKNQQQILIKEINTPQQRFEEIFSLGKASQQKIARNNLHSYGFGYCFGFQNCICFCTYDYRIMIYDLTSSQ